MCKGIACLVMIALVACGFCMIPQQVSGTQVDETQVLRAEHPHPEWYREKWESLNGWWDFSFDVKQVGMEQQWYLAGTKDYQQKINVPFPWQSELSGIGNKDYLGEAWYHRVLSLDDSWFADGKRVFLNFGGVDANCKVYINGQQIGSHAGGYSQFEFDITPYVQTGDNHLTVWVEDFVTDYNDTYGALMGKQIKGGYTRIGGIWQTVYLESRTTTYLEYAHIDSDIDNKMVDMELCVQSAAAQTVQVAYQFESKLWDEKAGEDVSTGSVITGTQKLTLTPGKNVISLDTVSVPDAKLWSHKEANLYYGTFTLSLSDTTVVDSVDTYFGMRKIGITDQYRQANKGFDYITLNNEPVYIAGSLNQGYWPNGIQTAPSEQALKSEALMLKEMGFNMMRIHIKVEDPLQYYWCDKLGIMVFQDMPQPTDANATESDPVASGRPIYEECMLTWLSRDYNHPCVVQLTLFNEDWGINYTSLSQDQWKATDGLKTYEWVAKLYGMVKEYRSDLLIVENDTNKQNHIQPTDINTFHMYPRSYSAALRRVNNFATDSVLNFQGNYVRENEPLMNSEYIGFSGPGDWDVSLCFKYQTDIMRRYATINGFVLTQSFDVEYEHNGLRTYDRRTKVFPYNEIAYGGDMTVADLVQPHYVGIDIKQGEIPATETADSDTMQIACGEMCTVDAVALNFSSDTFTAPVLKWRFDATDVYGNYFTTGLSGEEKITYPSYTLERKTISFQVPEQKCVGTLTVWIEENGNKIAKNYINVVVSDATSAKRQESLGGNAYALRARFDKNESFTDAGKLSYTYDLPEGFDLNTLHSMRVLLEASSVKKSSTVNNISFGEFSQTAEGGEVASDMTVTVNGIEIDTVYLPDNPRDCRGTLTTVTPLKDGASAGDFGYLVDLRISGEQLAQVQKAVASEGKIVLTCSVKNDAANRNGLRIYTQEDGRYMLAPTILLNPAELVTSGKCVTPTAANYTVEAILAEGEQINLRGGAYSLVYSGGKLTLGDQSVAVGEGSHSVRVQLFDDHIQVYVDGGVEPAIDTYIYGEITDYTVTTTGNGLVVTPETYTGDGMEHIHSFSGDCDGSCEVDGCSHTRNAEGKHMLASLFATTCIVCGGTSYQNLILVAVIAAVVMIIGIGALVLIRKKKKKA